MSETDTVHLALAVIKTCKATANLFDARPHALEQHLMLLKPKHIALLVQMKVKKSQFSDRNQVIFPSGKFSSSKTLSLHRLTSGTCFTTLPRLVRACCSQQRLTIRVTEPGGETTARTLAICRLSTSLKRLSMCTCRRSSCAKPFFFPFANQ